MSTIVLVGSTDEWEHLLSGVISARESGDYTTSVKLSNEALKFAEDAFGKEDKYYFLSLSQLGTTYQMSGAMEEAEAIFNRALKEKERLFGSDHPSVAASLFQLGQVELKKGRREVAEQLFMRANAISLTHPESNRMIDSLAFNLRDRDRTLQLEERYLYELQAYELELGTDHPELLVVLNNLGSLFQFQGRYEEAIEMYSRVTIWDGATVVMGGLTREEVKEVNDKVPFLGDLPLLGRFFQSKGESSQKRNLLIFVTANMVSPGGSLKNQDVNGVPPGSTYQNPAVISPAGPEYR